MKNNTYIASGFQYGLVNSYKPKTEGIQKMFEPVEESCNKPTLKEGITKLGELIPLESLVPFESVDGLTLRDLKDYPSLLFGNRYMVFLMYDYIPFHTPINVVPNARARYAVLIDTEKNQDYGIDEVLEDYFVRNVCQIEDDALKKRILCFLEKYTCCDSRVDVNNVIYNSTKCFVHVKERLRYKNDRK